MRHLTIALEQMLTLRSNEAGNAALGDTQLAQKVLPQVRAAAKALDSSGY